MTAYRQRVMTIHASALRSTRWPSSWSAIQKSCNVIRLASSPERDQAGVAPTSECDDRLAEVFPGEEISERLAHLLNPL